MRSTGDELLPTRASLLHRLKDWRDQVSWQKFFDTYWPLIYGVARRAGLSDGEAQDVVQETMVHVARHMPCFLYDPAQGSFKAWLLNLTRWRIIDQARKRPKLPAPEATAARDDRVPPLEELIDPASHDLDALWEAEWQNNLLNAAVANIKRRVEPQTYQLFDFNVNKAWPAAKVAATFSVPVERVHLAKHRVTEMLRLEVERLEREGA